MLARHRELWALFMARQYQRYCLEYFMHCFERCLAKGLRTVAVCAADISKQLGAFSTFRAVCDVEAAAIGLTGDMSSLSDAWSKRVHGQSQNYDWGEDLDDDGRPEESAMRMLARWHLRTFGQIAQWHGLEQLDWDGPDRISIRWFSAWLEQKADLPLARFLEDLLTQFVFTQHLRVAMGRFDGRDVQRLRFCLDDNGIVRTAAVEHDEPLEPSWMADRFEAFVSLLCDLDIVQKNDGKLSLGPLAELVPEFGWKE